MKEQVVYDSNSVPFIIITGVRCNVCGDAYATVVVAPHSIANPSIERCTPLIKFCPCGAKAVNTSVTNVIMCLADNLNAWL